MEVKWNAYVDGERRFLKQIDLKVHLHVELRPRAVCLNVSLTLRAHTLGLSHEQLSTS